jgi:hypothetical protein
MKLNVPFYAQRIGLIRPPRIDDPDGCWYASAKMIGTYHEGTFFGSRRGVPELTNENGTHQAIGRLPDGRDGFSMLLKNEKLEALVSPPDFGIDYLTETLKDRGPILFYWWSINYATKVAFSHASVMIGTSDLGGLRDVIYHDPAVGPDQTMALTTLQSLRQTANGLRQPFAARTKSTIPDKKVDVISATSISYSSP